MPTHFVSTEEIKKLTLNSYEYLASRVDEAISKDAKRVFGDVVPNKVERIGTFADHVIVAADDGRFVKVQYEQAADGSLKILAAEPVMVSVYTESSLDTYLMQEARGVVDSLLAHDGDQAELKLRSLLPFVEESLAPTAEQLTTSVIESVRADRPWKRLYRERAEQVRTFLGDSLKGIEARKLPPKFVQLFGEAVTEESAAKYDEVVRTDLAFMSETIGGWLRLVEDAGSLKDVEAKVTGNEKAVVVTFSAFAEDLKRDLQCVRDAIQESVQSIKSAVCLGKLYDALTEESFHYEVASRFASTMVEELRKSE